MSIGALGVIGGLSAAPLAQKSADAERTQNASVQQQRQVAGELQAENAAGIGQTDGEQEASDRDADGRRLWEVNPPAKPNAAEPEANAAQSIDLSGNRGGQLDLTI
ncbi:MAG TPA: hypothetical protein VFE24_00195 [Pirellulales bacterium]|jgi:hypothetical protein|nr:hypothetical protein [Pirellulales bacterium]